ncbi:unnamed protein product [Meloidogyne enterolobii]|uniref:Uncharacterized protein n=1 Tax=Meloidogyne enterolobii TaxID=390850 RepID=A0ACB1AZS8_MELEN
MFKRKIGDKKLQKKKTTGQIMIYTTQGILHRSKFAGFDMDCTSIKTKFGRVFPPNNDDLQF